MNIAFFVSNHGYGHLMRELPVIAELLDRGHKVVLVTAEKHLRLSENYLKEHTAGKLITVADEVDVGIIVKPGTLLADWDAMKKSLRAFISSWPEKQKMAKKIFTDYSIDRVLADIVPWAIPAAKEMNIPVYLSSNFTWLEQYEGNLPLDVLQPFRECYAKPDKVFFQALASERMRSRYSDGTDVGFFCRPFNEAAVKAIRARYKLPVVYVSVGGSNSGIDETVEVGSLPYEFIVTFGLKFTGSNVTCLPVETDNTNDYIAAADYCITKAGWGTIAEEMIAGKKTALINRPDVPEDMDNIAGLDGRAIGVDISELKHPERIIEKLKAMDEPGKSKNNYKAVADLITAL